MAFQVGDWVVAESESTERSARRGTVREAVHEDPHARGGWFGVCAPPEGGSWRMRRLQ